LPLLAQGTVIKNKFIFIFFINFVHSERGLRAL